MSRGDDIRVIVGGTEPNVDGSLPYPCSECGATVYLAPGGQRRLAEDAALAVICGECADALMAKSDNVVSEAADPDELLRELMREMGSIHYVLIDRKPVLEPDLLVWARWFESGDDRIVKQERIGPYHVSTVFLGLDHNFRRTGPPILFETMIFPTVQLDYQTRCATWEEAEVMHEQAAAAVRRMVNG